MTTINKIIPPEEKWIELTATKQPKREWQMNSKKYRNMVTKELHCEEQWGSIVLRDWEQIPLSMDAEGKKKKSHGLKQQRYK